MRMSRPVVVLTFADSPSDPLDSLTKEAKGIVKKLQDLDDKEVIRLYPEEKVTINSVCEIFNRFQDRVEIFHYGGHANSLSLAFIDGKVIAKPLAEFIAKEASKLQLVFLNGCGTIDQVIAFQELGVPYIIATQGPIHDDKAAEFAIYFYELLSKKRTVEESFDLATLKLKAQDKLTEKDCDVYRGLISESQSGAIIHPWSLFILPQKSINWKIGDTKRIPNGELCRVMIKAVEPFSSKAQKFLERQTQELWWQEPQEVNGARKALFGSFCNIVGNLINQLIRVLPSNELRKEYQYVERCKDLVNKTLDLFNYALLSSLWEAQKTQYQPLQSSHYQVLLRFFDDSNGFNIQKRLELLKALSEIFHQHGITLPLSELEELLDSDQFWKTGGELSRLLEKYREIVKLNDCFEIENELVKWLEPLSFLVTYRMESIKSIQYQGMKATPPNYLHYSIELAATGEKDHEFGKEDYRFSKGNRETEAVVLSKIGENDGVNLFPFIIDYNAIIEVKRDKICLFDHVDDDSNLNYIILEDSKRSLFSLQSMTKLNGQYRLFWENPQLKKRESNEWQEAREHSVAYCFHQARQTILGENQIETSEDNNLN